MQVAEKNQMKNTELKFFANFKFISLKIFAKEK